jgi:hypothetical protein
VCGGTKARIEGRGAGGIVDCSETPSEKARASVLLDVSYRQLQRRPATKWTMMSMSSVA